MRLVVVGGGIAGMSAAAEAREEAGARGMSLEVKVLERQDRLGGHIRTVRRDGFVIETGPDCFLSYKAGGMDLVRRLGITGEVVGTRPEKARTYVWMGSQLHPLPEGTMLMVPTQILPLARSRLLSWPGKLRMGMDLVLPKVDSSADETLGDFVRRRLGRQALERIAEPLVAGVHAGDPDRLSLQATFPRFRAMEEEHGSLIRAMLRARKRREAAPGGLSAFVTLRDGLETLVDGLTELLGPETVHTGTQVDAIRRADSGRGYVVTGSCAGEEFRWGTDAVLLAVPADRAAGMVEALDPSLAGLLGGIEFASVATATCGFRADQVARELDGYGMVAPRSQGTTVTGVTWSSAKFPGRAPDGHVLLRAFMGGAKAPQVEEMTEDDLLDAALREIGPILGISGEPAVAVVNRWPDALAQYNVGHLERMRRIDSRVRGHSGLALAGGSYRGIGIPDCAAGGAAAAQELVAELG